MIPSRKCCAATLAGAPCGYLAIPMMILICLGFLGCGGTADPVAHEPAALTVLDLWPAAGGGSPTFDRPGCDLLAGPTTGGGHFVFALVDSVRPGHAPVPGNLSERVVFAQLYETLVTVACSGRVEPGLAASWTRSADGRIWTLTLRQDARFWDGTPISAAVVRKVLAPRLDTPLRVLDEQRLAFGPVDPKVRFLQLLADPALAVAISRPGWIWPVGSGPCRLRASDPAPLPELTCLPNRNHPRGPAWDRLTFRVLPGTDPRDLVATDLDLALVRRQDVVAFFQDVPGFACVPLPWNRIYYLVCSPEADPVVRDRWITAGGKFDASRDVTTVSARPWSDILFPAGGSTFCPQLYQPVRPVGSARLDWNLAAKNLGPEVLVYPDDDPGAREIAQRLGALAGSPMRTVALPLGGVDFALQWQMAGAFVVALNQTYPTGCRQLAALLGKAAWLQDAAWGVGPSSGDSLAGADQAASLANRSPAVALLQKKLVLPLSLSRTWLVVRGSLGGLDLTHDGIPLVAGLGKTASAAPDEATP